MYYLYIVAGLALLASLVVSRENTARALKVAARRFITTLPAFLLMLVAVSLTLFLVPEEVIVKYLASGSKCAALLLASVLGSLTLMPGFVAFPLAGVLLSQGVPYMVLSAFTTTLMMVGVLTYPVERTYLGMKVTVLRNAVGLLIALVVAIMTGIFFGEVFD